MPYLMVRHSVKDYDAWKPMFDDHAAVRKEMGSKGGQLFRSVDDGNDIVMVVEVEDIDRAREFVNSDDLRETMQRAGVEGPPTIVFLDEVDRLSA